MTQIAAPEFMAVLRQAVTAAGGIRPFSRKTGVNQAIVCQVVNGTVEPTESIANAIGYVRVINFMQARHVKREAA